MMSPEELSMTIPIHSPKDLAHGFQSTGDGGAWNVWAPRASRVDLVLLDGDASSRVPMQAVGGGWFQHTAGRVPTGQRYFFLLDGKLQRPDPASRWQPDGVHAASCVWRPVDFGPGEAKWQGRPLADLVIYELHVGSFTPEGTFEAIIPRLSALRSLGITAIELMPLGQFPGRHGWGYDGTYWFATQQSYGGPDGLLRLVEACHSQGLAVILDVIYNHLGPEGNYLHDFGHYFTEKHVTPWGAAINYDDSGCEGARSLVLDNVRHWIRNFHVDGLRLDAIHAICDDSHPHILAEIKRVAMEEQVRLGREVHVIAESNLNDVRLLDPPEQGGYGLDAQWSDDFHHCVHTLLTGESDGYYVDFADPQSQLVKALNNFFVYDGIHSPFRGAPCGRPIGDHGGQRFVVSIQTHDQVGNRARGERLSALVSPAQQRIAACLLLLAPNIPMLFMGEEYGELSPFPFFCDFGDPVLQEAVRKGRREEFADFAWSDEVPDPLAETTYQSAQLTWDWPEGTLHAGLRRLYGDLLQLRRTQPALGDFRHRAARLMTGEDGHSLLELTRGESKNGLLCIFNLGDQAAKLPAVPVNMTLLFRSEVAPYRCVPPEPVDLNLQQLQPFECLIFGASTSSNK